MSLNTIDLFLMESFSAPWSFSAQRSPFRDLVRPLDCTKFQQCKSTKYYKRAKSINVFSQGHHFVLDFAPNNRQHTLKRNMQIGLYLTKLTDTLHYCAVNNKIQNNPLSYELIQCNTVLANAPPLANPPPLLTTDLPNP